MNTKTILSIIKLNSLFPIEGIIKKIKIKNLDIVFEWRKKNNLWGRFGGGWNWKFGFMAAGNTIIISIVVFSIRFDFNKKEYKGKENK